MKNMALKEWSQGEIHVAFGFVSCHIYLSSTLLHAIFFIQHSQQCFNLYIHVYIYVYIINNNEVVETK